MRFPALSLVGTLLVLLAIARMAALVVAKHLVLGDSRAAFPALRELGLLELALAAFAMLAFAAAFWPYPVASFLHGLTVAAVLSDPAATLWFQTLYTEFPAIFGAYAVVAGLVAALAREKLTRWL